MFLVILYNSLLDWVTVLVGSPKPSDTEHYGVMTQDYPIRKKVD